MSTVNSLDIIVNKLLYLFMYNKMTKKIKIKVRKLISIIINSKTKIKNNRHYPRLRKKPASKWCLNGIKLFNKYKYKKKKKYIKKGQ